MSEHNKKKSLGRGLSALLNTGGDNIETIAPASRNINQAIGGVSLISLEEIEVNPFQPRTRFEEQSLNELTASIVHYGLIQPITVRRLSKDKYQLISGERRIKASQLAGLKEIPAYVRLADDVAMLEMALIENTHRQDLDAIEIALGYSRLIEECKLTQEELSNKIGKDRSSVTNFLRLLKLPPVIQLAIREGKITMGHARALINIDNPAAQLSVFDRILDESLNVRDTEETAKKIKQKNGNVRQIGDNDNEAEPEDRELEDELTDLFSSTVKLSRSAKGKGKVVIAFTSDEELRRIISLIKN